MALLELAVHDSDGIAVAARVGVDRIELCTALGLGGLTPSQALTEAAVSAHAGGGPPVHALIRPRAGDFAYAAADRAVIVRDVELAVGHGVAGVVVGGTDGPGVDVDLLERVRAAAGSAEVTFHRAFDTVADRAAAIEVLVDNGITRILTSGGGPAAADRLTELAALTEAAADRIEIMAGAGVDRHNIMRILQTGVSAVHASAKRLVTRRMAVSLGSASPAGEATIETTDEDEAAALLALVRSREAVARR